MQAHSLLIHAVRDRVSGATVSLYGRASLRVLGRGLAVRRLRPVPNQRLVFVVGSPRSGTTFAAGALASLEGFVDLGEVLPLKAAVPYLAAAAEDEAAGELQRILERVRRLAFVRSLRSVEQTPELAFLVRAALCAYPLARVVHIVRDGRDVVSSLLERGWLGRAQGRRDDVGAPYGAHPRFWVEPERVDEFVRTSEARRAAWAWRRHVTAARDVNDERVLEVRYEQLTGGSGGADQQLARHLGVEAAALAVAFTSGNTGSIGRWRRELAPEQLDDVEREGERSYANSGTASGAVPGGRRAGRASRSS